MNKRQRKILAEVRARLDSLEVDDGNYTADVLLRRIECIEDALESMEVRLCELEITNPSPIL